MFAAVNCAIPLIPLCMDMTVPARRRLLFSRTEQRWGRMNDSTFPSDPEPPKYPMTEELFGPNEDGSSPWKDEESPEYKVPARGEPSPVTEPPAENG